ncbi:MAG TPA: polyprenyl synthetase family protein [Acidimicrobiales bacterium]|nr:polyprenyl synthetase family protein [Acidimicrobiales bacterium]
MVNLLEALNLPHIDQDLARVEGALRRAVTAEDPFLTEVAGHLVQAGGKRLRPALVLATALTAVPHVTEDVVLGGVSVELVHLGSLYHDDVMDEAEVRRGVPSVNARWGNLVAILAGDFLLARASEIAAGLGTEVAALLAATIGRLCEGQIGELQTAYNADRTEEAYLAAIAGKTAMLMSTACRVGALVAELPRPEVEALTSLGRSFGMVFQIVDDILDIVETEEVLGKPAGHDMVEGVYTLPVIRALATSSTSGDLRALLGRPLDGPERDKARAIVRGSGGVEAAAGVARRFADEAAAHARGVDGAEALGDLGHRLIDSLPVEAS